MDAELFRFEMNQVADERRLAVMLFSENPIQLWIVTAKNEELLRLMASGLKYYQKKPSTYFIVDFRKYFTH